LTRQPSAKHQKTAIKKTNQANESTGGETYSSRGHIPFSLREKGKGIENTVPTSRKTLQKKYKEEKKGKFPRLDSFDSQVFQ